MFDGDLLARLAGPNMLLDEHALAAESNDTATVPDGSYLVQTDWTMLTCSSKSTCCYAATADSTLLGYFVLLG